jgi:hypothetical protein
LNVGQYEYAVPQFAQSAASVARTIVVPNVGSWKLPPAAGRAGSAGSAYTARSVT